jgi:hypothetical protein
MASPEIVATLTELIARFRAYSHERRPELVWDVIQDLDGRTAVERMLQARLRAEANLPLDVQQKAFTVVTVREGTGGGILLAAGTTVHLPAGESLLLAAYDAILQTASAVVEKGA